MSDKTLKILLGIIAVNLTFLTVRDVGLFPTDNAPADDRPPIVDPFAEQVSDAPAQETEIENEYNGYLEDFMVFDFEGIASHFTIPAMFIGASTQVMQDENAIKNYYRVLKANIQSGYAYSKSSLEINQVTDKIYCLTNTFTRHNSADEVLFEGTSYNFFKETESGWKLFLMQASALPD